MSSLLESTRNSRWVTTGENKFIRSDALVQLSAEDVSWLLQENVLTVVDLRSDEERASKPCCLEDNSSFRYLHMPVSGGGAIPLSCDEVSDSYISYVDDFFLHILDEVLLCNTNVIFFCNAGKDRTGVFAAMIQMVYGVDEKIIVDEYVQSKDNLSGVLEEYIQSHTDRDYSMIVPRARYMEEFLSKIKSKLRRTLTTLGYIEKDNRYLMLHRVKKENDLNKDKWVGIGGHFEGNETPDECMLRETREETGLTLTSYKHRGTVIFVSDMWPREHMYLYTADGFEGEMIECNEGNLEWVPKKDILSLPLWEGDKAFLKLLDETDEFFVMRLEYKGETLVSCNYRLKEHISYIGCKK